MQRLSLFLLWAITAFVALNPCLGQNDRPTVGLVLTGGGARGARRDRGVLRHRVLRLRLLRGVRQRLALLDLRQLLQGLPGGLQNPGAPLEVHLDRAHQRHVRRRQEGRR